MYVTNTLIINYSEKSIKKQPVLIQYILVLCNLNFET